MIETTQAATADSPPPGQRPPQAEPDNGLTSDNATELDYLAAIEAVLMVSDQPVPSADLAAAIGLPQDQTEQALIGLAAEYRGALGSRPRGFELREVGGGWRIYSAVQFDAIVEQFLREGRSARLTQAALETLAIVAYLGPVSRGRIAAIRGVNADSPVRTLLGRDLIDEVGQDPDSGAILYGTTTLFLERMGLTSLEELEALAPHLPRNIAEIEEQLNGTS
jgi:segregation and condensation protein B